jgi:hypothetical protein
MRWGTFINSVARGVLPVAAVLLLAGPARAQEAAEQDAVCPQTVGMFTDYQGEQFTGTGTKDEDLAFWARYNFVAHNQGGLGPIEMAGFFYLSKPECWLKGDRGVFIIYSPVIEYYGPRRDKRLACGDTSAPVPDDPTLGDPYSTSNYIDPAPPVRSARTSQVAVIRSHRDPAIVTKRG